MTIEASVAGENPDRGVVISNLDGAFNVYAWDVPTGSLRAVTTGDAATVEAAIAPDGSAIYHLAEDEPGTETGHLHRVPFEGGSGVDITPDLSPYTAFDIGAAGDTVHAAAGIEGGVAALVIRGAVVELIEVDGMPVDLLVDPASNTLVSVEAPVGQGLVTNVRVVDLADGSTVATLERATAGAVRHGVIAVAITDGEWMRPALWQRGADPEMLTVGIPGDVVPHAWTADGSALLLHQSHRSKTGLFLYDIAEGTTERLPVPPGAMLDSRRADILPDGRVLSIWSDSRTPNRPVFSTREGWSDALVGSTEVFDGPDWEEVVFPSTEGAEIQGWLLRPDGAGPFATVLYTHGGPTSVQQPVFTRLCQAWSDLGYAVLSVNYRGSTTFGESFREALTGRIGGPDVDDVVAAWRWLVDHGIADPDRVVKSGYSYGGYLTLQSLGTHPHLWAAGVAGAPVADYVMEYDYLNDILKAYSRSLFGGSPSEFPDEYRTASPISYVDDVTAPLFVSQPENDTRTPLPPVQAYVDALRRRGHPVVLDLLQGGHAGSGVEDEIAMFERWVAFVDDTLSGASN
jgi:acetyl esterase/lipase